MDFQQKHAIITGGSSGIGLATAKLLWLAGCNLSLIARNSEKLQHIQSELSLEKVYPQQKIYTYSADVSKQAEITATIKEAIVILGTPELLITAAGIVETDYFMNLSTSVFAELMAVNYFGSLYCLQAVLPEMQQHQKGHIVFVSSGAGLIGIYGYSAYSPSKFAVRGLAESLRLELKPMGINISIIYPPDTDTPQLQRENLQRPPETKAIAATSKVWSPEAIAATIIRGIETKAFLITPGNEISFLAKFHSLLVTPINWYFESKIKKVNRLTKSRN